MSNGKYGRKGKGKGKGKGRGKTKSKPQNKRSGKGQPKANGNTKGQGRTTDNLLGVAATSSSTKAPSPGSGSRTTGPVEPDEVKALQGVAGNKAVSSLVGSDAPEPHTEGRAPVGTLAADPARDDMLTRHLQQTGRVPKPKDTRPRTKLAPGAIAPEVAEHLSSRASLKAKSAELGTGADPGSLRETLGKHGVFQGLKDFFGAEPTEDTYDPTGMMRAVRLSIAVGTSDEAKEFLKVARDHNDEVKRLMANRPEHVRALLDKAEFGAMTKLIRAEIDAPSTSLVGGPSGAHQFDEHGAHSPAAHMILQSIASGNPKTSWVSATAEQQAVSWAQAKIEAEVAQLAQGVTTGPDSIGWKGDIAGARQIINDNRRYADYDDQWEGPGGVHPFGWDAFINDSETFRAQTVFHWYRQNHRGDWVARGTFRLNPVFNRTLDVLNASGADAGIAGTLAGRKVKAIASNVAEPVQPLRYPLLTDPDTTFLQGATYYYKNGNQWQEIKLLQYDEAPPLTRFKAVFRKTNDPALRYKVYTAYPV